jgi:oligopeptide transport system permease protein
LKNYILSRLIQFPFILAIIYLITFACVWIAPGDPFSTERGMDPAIIQQRKEQLHAGTWHEFLLHYPVAALHGDFGKSLNNLAFDVSELIWDRFLISLTLGSAALLIALVVGMAVGTFSAIKRDGVLDWLGVGFTLVGISIPSFVVAAGLMILFVAKLGWFPLGGGEGGPALLFMMLRFVALVAAAIAVGMTPGRGVRLVAMLTAATLSILAFVVGDVAQSWLLLVVALVASGALATVTGVALRIASAVLTLIALLLIILNVGAFPAIGQALWELLLPAIALSLAPMAYIVRLQRVSMLDVLGMDHIRTARAKGLAKPRVVLKHCLRNAFLPVFTYLGPAAAFTLTGSFVVERIFRLPGLGEQFVDSVTNRDATMILAQTMLYSVLLLTFNLLVDLGYAFIDPRIDVSAKKA